MMSFVVTSGVSTILRIDPEEIITRGKKDFVHHRIMFIFTLLDFQCTKRYIVLDTATILPSVHNDKPAQAALERRPGAPPRTVAVPDRIRAPTGETSLIRTRRPIIFFEFITVEIQVNTSILPLRIKNLLKQNPLAYGTRPPVRTRTNKQLT